MKIPYRRTIDTKPMDRILLWAAQSQGQWRSVSTELSPDRCRGWPPHPSLGSGGCSTIIEEREVNCSWRHPSRTDPSMWRGCNHHSHNNQQQDLADSRMANPVDPGLSHHTSQERQPAAVSELSNGQHHQSPQSSVSQSPCQLYFCWNLLTPVTSWLFAENN